MDQIQTNLHVVLCCSPVGNAFRTRARKFPAIVNCTTIDWFQAWPEQALSGVALRFLSRMDLGDERATLAVQRFMPLR